ncbi:uncharacterized protein LOC143240812 isoform X1 [Tachypleus tridentatus]|uniref:uncharacterized protein LOC143240812 isoform X1 n=1 Tax=Tachypleus tridentatus TaxID=6853 RepID=UPI003FD03FCE
MASIILLPDIGDPHPCPYTVSPDVDLRQEKKKSTKPIKCGNLKIAAQRFSTDKKFAREVIGLFLEDVIQEDLAEEIVRETLKEETDVNKLLMPPPPSPPKVKTVSTVAPLPSTKETFVQTDPTQEEDEISDDVLEDLIEDTVVEFQEANAHTLVWNTVLNLSRKMKLQEYTDQLTKNYKKHILDDNTSNLLIKKFARLEKENDVSEKCEKLVDSITFDVLLCQSYKWIKSKKVTGNYAFNKLQNKLYNQSILNRLAESYVIQMEKDLKTQDFYEMKENPPRTALSMR